MTGGGGTYTTSSSPNVPALRYDPGGRISCRRMLMENLVMTTLTIEELDATVTADAMCLHCGCYAPEELDATAEATAACGCRGCWVPVTKGIE